MATVTPPPLQVFRRSDSPSTLSAEQEEIIRLKKEKNAVLLCHNYQIDPIQEVADYVGDSLGLARQAAQTDAEIIVFCGVHFMAETAKILNPSKTVLLPDLDAGCSLSDSCPAEQLASIEKKTRTYMSSPMSTAPPQSRVSVMSSVPVAMQLI